MVQQALERCLQAARTGGTGVMRKCAAVYANGLGWRRCTAQHDAQPPAGLLAAQHGRRHAARRGRRAGSSPGASCGRCTGSPRPPARPVDENLSQRLALRGPRDELRELADTFDAMLERLDRAFTSQRQFIANASHELRTPLTVMRTAIDIILAKPEPTRAELVSMATEIRQAVDHSERLIEVLLVLARNDRARALADPLDLAAVAQDALEGRTASGVTTTATLGEAPVTGDGVLLEGLVANLLENAERYNIPGGTVCISTTTDDGASASASRQHQPGRTTRPGRAPVPAIHPARRPHPPRRLRSRPRTGVVHRSRPQRNRERHRRPRRRPGHHCPPPATRHRRRRRSLARRLKYLRLAVTLRLLAFLPRCADRRLPHP